jgi:hypothetical protein
MRTLKIRQAALSPPSGLPDLLFFVLPEAVISRNFFSGF